jgi:hypothetical protein
MRDIRTNLHFQWPTKALIMSAVSCGCHLLPIGQIPREKKKEVNQNFSLEW